MSKNVTIIPPSEGRSAILRVAAYCRVSTDSDDQATSYASQIRSYTELISQHEGWELVDIYADEPYHWTTPTVASMLNLKEYLGHTVNFKTAKKSFKSKHSTVNPEEKQVVFLA